MLHYSRPVPTDTAISVLSNSLIRRITHTLYLLESVWTMLLFEFMLWINKERRKWQPNIQCSKKKKYFSLQIATTLCIPRCWLQMKKTAFRFVSRDAARLIFTDGWNINSPYSFQSQSSSSLGKNLKIPSIMLLLWPFLRGDYLCP